VVGWSSHASNIVMALASAVLAALSFVRRSGAGSRRTIRRRRLLERRLARYRESNRRLRARAARLWEAIDQLPDAVLFADAQGRVTESNRRAIALLANADRERIARWIGTIVQQNDSGVAESRALEVTMDWPDTAQHCKALAWHSEDGAVGLLLHASAESHSACTTSRNGPAHTAARRLLVELTFDMVESWERSGGTRIGLAEQTGVWRVTDDDGRLRIRSLERYLSVARLPQRPRWGDVLRAAQFVQAHPSVTDADRARLAGLIERLRDYLRRHALD